MSDLISRQDAIEKLEYFCMVKALEDQNHPSAEARTQMSSADLISRQAAIDAIEEIRSCIWDVDIPSPTVPEYIEHHKQMQELMDRCDILRSNLVNLPSAERWISLKTRPMTEEERKEWSEKLGYDIDYDEAVIYTSQLPDDEQECIVCTKWGHVFIDTFQNDPDYGCCFDAHGDMDGITAWMPLPEPYRMEAENDNLYL